MSRAKKVTIDGDMVNLTKNRVCNPEIPDGTSEYGLCTEGYLSCSLGGCSVGQEGTVAVHIRHLREKIEADPSEPRYIKVVWGQGYMFGKE